MTGMAGGSAVREDPAGVRDLPAHRWLVTGGALLTAGALLLLSFLPEPPGEAVALTTWVEQARPLLTWSDELLFFAVLCWGAGARGLFGARTAAPSARIDVGAAALTTALVALVVVLLALGRLIYPVFAIDLAPEAVTLLVSATFGAVHLAFLGFAVAAAALTWSTRTRILGRGVGIVAAAAFLAGSFPWMMPAWANSLAAIAVAAWGVFLAFTSATSPADAAPHPS